MNCDGKKCQEFLPKQKQMSPPQLLRKSPSQCGHDVRVLCTIAFHAFCTSWWSSLSPLSFCSRSVLHHQKPIRYHVETNFYSIFELEDQTNRHNYEIWDFQDDFNFVYIVVNFFQSSPNVRPILLVSPKFPKRTEII